MIMPDIKEYSIEKAANIRLQIHSGYRLITVIFMFFPSLAKRKSPAIHSVYGRGSP